ncbi:VanZ family protein [Mesonia maritima]|uniref:VanZ family protein n=1 Tax=Mesonia maritima TaxID=1793873 RepID=A0ABU1K3H3_9FLAO|nr:VanZ family protein [Mesonia maritima]MDR6300173.1 VanZ family protein [Mesonia maritima]
MDPKVSLILALLYTVSLLVVSLIHTEDLPKPNFNNADKVFHCIAYFGLTLCWYFQYFSRKNTKVLHRKSLLIICLLTTAFGIFIEVLQGVFTTYRSIDAFDVLANTTGIIIAFFLIISIKTPLEKIKHQL